MFGLVLAMTSSPGMVNGADGGIAVFQRFVPLIFMFGIWPLSIVWPSGWSWGQPESLQMIIGIYFTLGLFLLLASRDPLAHRSLIWFTVWSSVVHAVIMAWQAISDTAERGHLVGDVPALLVVAVLLAALTPRAPARA